MRRSLTYYWRINLAVLLSAAVATAVLTGAFLVGDSVRGSLRDLTLDRLGGIDYALLSHKYFDEELVAGLASSSGFGDRFDRVASGILTTGNTVHSKSKSRASGINLIAADAPFFSFYDTANSDTLLTALQKKSGQIFPSIVINRALQKQLNAEVGDQILLSFEKPSDIARGSLLGRKGTEDVVESVRLTLTHILPDEGAGRFSLQPNQNLPLNAYVALPVLQKALQEQDNINAIFISEKKAAPEEDAMTYLQTQLHDLLNLDYLTLTITYADDFFTLESRASILSPQVSQLTRDILNQMQAPYLTVYTYLANKMEVGDNLLPYSTVTALSMPVPEPLGALTLRDGRPAPSLTGKEILLNTWAAQDLKAQVGDTLKMTYFGVGAGDQLFREVSEFEVRGIVAMTGLAADSTLTPDYPGISDVQNMADWDPPFPVDLGLIRPKDEVYWDRYKGTPKAFVSGETGRDLWGSRFGDVTSIKIASADDMTLSATQEEFEQRLLQSLDPEQAGFAFQPVKQQGLESSSGATDFSGLFFGFSLFLIVSAALLVGLLFRLGVEQRAHEVGMLLAVGFPVKKVRRKFLLEGGVLALIGGLLGLAGATFYAWLMIFGLRTWWREAVGTPFLFLHVQPESLIIGYVISLLVVIASIWLGFRKLSKIPPPALLAGVTEIIKEVHPGRVARITAWASLTVAALLTVLALFTDTSSAGLFFGIGTLLLIAGLAFFSIWLKGKHAPLSAGAGTATVVRMAARNSPRNPGRSMLSAALVACACFVIVAVESFRQDFGGEVLQMNSGAGGYSLVAEADIPLHNLLSTEEGRFDLGFSDRDSEKLEQCEITPFRLRPGDDASCLNLYRVERPRILGVTPKQIERGGFKFQGLTDLNGDNGQTNPWRLLEQELEPGVIPAFGDYNSVLWILHSGLSEDFEITNQFGEKIKLRFVGLLQKSIFQSELLISEENFLQHFPGQGGYGYFLIETPADEIQPTAELLEKTLTDYGFDATTTAAKLASFQAVENTYLSTFQTLGGFGLLLGTLGLGIILIRNVIERRGELATLRAFGFRQSLLALMVLAENGFLLALGIFIGGVSALIAVAPHVFGQGSSVPWLSLAVILGVVFLVGMLASSAAVRAAVKIPLLPALRAE